MTGRYTYTKFLFGIEDQIRVAFKALESDMLAQF